MKHNILLVSGTRNLKTDDPRADYVRVAIDQFVKNCDDNSNLLIHGGAQGVDSLCNQYWLSREYGSTLAWPADWKRLGRPAGPRRNESMVSWCFAQLTMGSHVEVVVFPSTDSRGTWDLYRRAEEYNLDPRIVKL